MAEEKFRRTAILVGGLFIIATLVSLVSMFFLGDSLEGTEYILGIPDVEESITLAAIFEIVLAISLIGIGSLMFPVLRQVSPGLALSYAGIRLTEAVLIVIGALCLLMMIGVGGDFESGTITASEAGSLGALITSMREGSLLVGTLIFLGLGGIVLNYALLRSMLVPRWLSLWGLVGGIGILAYGTLGLFGTDTGATSSAMLLAMPLAVQEMALAVVLIVKGFAEPRAIDHGFPKAVVISTSSLGEGRED